MSATAQAHHPHEFRCTDCGHNVVTFYRSPDDPDRCAICRFVRSQPAEDREAIRSRVYDLESWEYWTMVGSYRDNELPERRCDACNTPYRGPAVYCCHRCATADA
jgi:hypothetical protein